MPYLFFPTQTYIIWLVWFLMNRIIGNDEVGVDGLVVDDGPHHHVDMPDGVGQGDEAVRLKEHHPRHVDSSARLQLLETGSVFLGWGQPVIKVRPQEVIS